MPCPARQLSIKLAGSTQLVRCPFLPTQPDSCIASARRSTSTRAVLPLPTTVPHASRRTSDTLHLAAQSIAHARDVASTRHPVVLRKAATKQGKAKDYKADCTYRAGGGWY
jgi:hypothetical protein